VSYRLWRINRYLRNYDRKLYAREFEGTIQVWRHADFDPYNMVSPDNPPAHFIMALTDNFNFDGKPVDMGIEVFMNRLKNMDQWRKRSALEEVRKNRERMEESKLRHRRNEFQAYAADNRRLFAKATNDINTSTLEKNRRI